MTFDTPGYTCTTTHLQMFDEQVFLLNNVQKQFTAFLVSDIDHPLKTAVNVKAEHGADCMKSGEKGN